MSCKLKGSQTASDLTFLISLVCVVELNALNKFKLCLSGISITSEAFCLGPSRWTAVLSSSTKFSSHHSLTSRVKEVSHVIKAQKLKSACSCLYLQDTPSIHQNEGAVSSKRSQLLRLYHLPTLIPEFKPWAPCYHVINIQMNSTLSQTCVDEFSPSTWGPAASSSSSLTRVCL